MSSILGEAPGARRGRRAEVLGGWDLGLRRAVRREEDGLHVRPAKAMGPRVGCPVVEEALWAAHARAGSRGDVKADA
eukprot:CAMPEP_0115065586 /NCGR_PEP_ID=MMETSP0227-20121206/10336_1 /TAXON_ID=89957 /ORGANISM="Polarella glacialis, Strain CCMP 1383" /LENGTH=76 /DNA_ID=CAMNT_0002451397 /DNA_START=872 /DNA_END=1103 /DNA_ORIENTATION=-